jgi:hypothetical protein
MSTVKLVVELVVHGNQLADFKRIAREMHVIVQRDGPLTVESQWFFHKGDDKWYLTEVFPDSDAFLQHLANVALPLEQLLGLAAVSRFEVFGELSLAARATMAALEVNYFTLWERV